VSRVSDAPEANAAEDLRRAQEAVTAMFTEGDPMGLVRGYREALDEDSRTGGDMRRIGLASAITLITGSALHELDRVAGRSGYAQRWLQDAALRNFEEPGA
jgi:hypothetical protein